MAEKERIAKAAAEAELAARLEAERLAKLAQEALERDQRLQLELIKTREENNKMFCQAPISLSDKEKTANPFFNARASASKYLSMVSWLCELTCLCALFGLAPLCLLIRTVLHEYLLDVCKVISDTRITISLQVILSILSVVTQLMPRMTPKMSMMPWR